MLYEQFDLAEAEPLKGGLRWLVPALVAAAAASGALLFYSLGEPLFAGLFMAVFAKPTIVCVKAPCDNPPITEMVVGSTLFFAGSVGAGVGGGWLIQDGASGEADVRVGVGHLQLDF